MTDWKPDLQYIDFLAKLSKSQGMDNNMLGLGDSEGRYSLNDHLDEMRQGTDRGRRFYQHFYGIQDFQKKYQEYLKNPEQPLPFGPVKSVLDDDQDDDDDF